MLFSGGAEAWPPGTGRWAPRIPAGGGEGSRSPDSPHPQPEVGRVHPEHHVGTGKFLLVSCPRGPSKRISPQADQSLFLPGAPAGPGLRPEAQVRLGSGGLPGRAAPTSALKVAEVGDPRKDTPGAKQRGSSEERPTLGPSGALAAHLYSGPSVRRSCVAGSVGPLHEPSSPHHPFNRKTDLFVDTSLSTWTVPPRPPPPSLFVSPSSGNFPTSTPARVPLGDHLLLSSSVQGRSASSKPGAGEGRGLSDPLCAPPLTQPELKSRTSCHSTPHCHSVLSPPSMAPLLTLFLVALVGLPLGKTDGEQTDGQTLVGGRTAGSGEGGQAS